MAYAGTGCPILKQNGLYDNPVKLSTTAWICMDACPLPFCVLDYETKQGNNRNDVRVAVLWYSGKSAQQIAKIIGWEVETVGVSLAKWLEIERKFTVVR